MRYGTQKEDIADEIRHGTFRGYWRSVPDRTAPDVDEFVERWQPVPGFDTVEASSEGRVRVVQMIGTGKNDDGYPVVGLVRDDKSVLTRPVHSLVADVFLVPRTGPVVRHLDGNKLNNRMENLAYGTAADNSADEVRLGRTNPATRTNKRRRLTVTAVRSIREDKAVGCRNVDLAKKYGVSSELISAVTNGRIWKIPEAGHATPRGLARGSDAPKAKLTEEQVVEMRELSASGVPTRELAEKYGVSWNAARFVIQRRTWRHVA
jgi:hypothetical protein